MGVAIPPQVVEEFVRVAHSDADRTRALLAEHPGLLNACHDWGAGDWETALGAAAHMGRRDIAEFLLGQGARMDLFAAAMLGKLAIVQAILADDPTAASRPGPHNIGLMMHAKKGGAEAKAVVEYLQSLGGDKKVAAKNPAKRVAKAPS